METQNSQLTPVDLDFLELYTDAVAQAACGFPSATPLTAAFLAAEAYQDAEAQGRFAQMVKRPIAWPLYISYVPRHFAYSTVAGLARAALEGAALESPEGHARMLALEPELELEVRAPFCCKKCGEDRDTVIAGHCDDCG
jgi:hypothetical protein